MIDWTSSMQQTYEYYIVDPGTWKDVSKIDNVISSTIKWDSSAETLGSATININGIVKECYIRIYMIIIQNELREKIPMGTFLVQTPSCSFNGKTKSMSLDAYTPLIELKEKYTPIGYSILKNENILDIAYKISKESMRAPVIQTKSNEILTTNFIAGMEDTLIGFLADLIANAKYKFGLDELSRVVFIPDQDTRSLKPIWTYTDDNSSILYPELSIDHDLYGIPNVVEVIYSNNNNQYYGKAINDNPNSPTSTIARGREITHRITNPSILGNPSEEQIQEYSEKMLRELSTVEYTITYKHGYCPVRVGDCVRLNYRQAGINGIKAKVISQSIDCVSGCPVTEKAIFSAELWG